MIYKRSAVWHAYDAARDAERAGLVHELGDAIWSSISNTALAQSSPTQRLILEATAREIANEAQQR